MREPAPKDGALLAILLDALLLAVVAAQHWHHTRHHGQQAEAARQTAEHPHATYQAAAIQPLTAIHQRGLRLTVSVQLQQAALAATLTDAQKAGHDPTVLHAEGTRRRELDSAPSISDVLVWRLHRLVGMAGERPAHPDSASATRLGSSSTVLDTSRQQPPRRSSRQPQGRHGHWRPSCSSS